MAVFSDTQILIYQIIVVIMIFQTVMYCLFASFGFIRYFNRKKTGKVSFYYALVNLSFLFATTSVNAGLTDLLEKGTRTTVYEMSLIGMNVWIVIASLFLYYFYSEMSGIPQKPRIYAVVFAIIICIVQVLAYDVYFGITLKLKYIGYTLQTIYCASIYITAARGFNFLRKNIPEQSTAFSNIMLSFILNVVYFFMMLTRAFIPSGTTAVAVIQIGSWVIQLASVFLLFFGFMYPILTKNKKEEVKET